MNRTEKRRQRKKAETATKNAKPVQPASPSPEQQTLTIQQSLDLALRHHTQGRLPEAESIYQRILQAEPNQPDALHLLGVIALGNGKYDLATEFIAKALAVKPDYAEAHNNLGNAFKGLGKLDEAVACYHEALAIKPDYDKAHNNLGVALQDLGRLDDAVASCHKALAIKPDFAEAHYNLGNAFKELGRLEEAVASHLKALAIKPVFAEAHNNLGVALIKLEKLDEAVASYREALSIEPDYAEVHNNLGIVLKELGKPEDAFTHHRSAIALDPENDLFWDGLAESLETLSFTFVDENLWQDLLCLLDRPRVTPSRLVRPVISALRHHPDFSRILELTGSGKPETGMAYGDVAGQLSAIPLFLRIMGPSLIDDLEIERMLTFLRAAMIKKTVAGEADGKGVAFSAALALHCFTNEYVFPETDEEKAAVERLQQRIAALLEKERDVPPSFVAALGAYRPLHGFPWARELSGREWTGDIKEVIKRQISEPGEERSLRSQIPRLTSIQDGVSQAVREQYEENPYPRWIKTGGKGIKGRAISDVLQGAPLRLDLGDYQSPESPEILVAGCGTGRHAITTAFRFSNARVLAVDLSLSSLSYALRITKEFDVSNIEYAQADIMELDGLARRFDLIECIGTLVCIGDPLAGWRILVDLLRPGGLMMIGLYSEAARQNIISGRALIADKGYTTSAEDIRRCRQDIIAMAEDGDRMMAETCASRDFFSLSECRDLLFHVKEHRFTLPWIDDALTSLKLKFLGFQMRSRALRKFRKSHPSRSALNSLSLWHEFELENPDTFRGMYQFWCRKM